MNWKKYAVVMMLLLATGCENPKKYKGVSQEESGETWPLTVPNGQVSCVRNFGKVVTFISLDGKEYALNETAKGLRHFLPIEEIWKPDPTNPPAKKDIGVLIDEGLKLCP